MSREMSTPSRSLPPDQTTILLLVQIREYIRPDGDLSSGGSQPDWSKLLADPFAESPVAVLLRRFTGDQIDSFSHDMDLRGAYAGSNSLDYVNYTNMYTTSQAVTINVIDLLSGLTERYLTLIYFLQLG